MSKNLYFSNPSSLGHDTGAHPECAARITAIEAELERQDWLGYRRITAPAAETPQLTAVHPLSYIESIRDACTGDGGFLDADTLVSSGSWQAALDAAGAAVAMADALLSAEAAVAFCGLRPPGHHAEVARAMGFCLFNNVAVAARRALDRHGLDRVLVFDWDVHHGNGTNDIFYATDEVLYVSIHQMPLYPGSGILEESGSEKGEGYTVNLPLPPGAGEEHYLQLIEWIVAPIVRSYEPELILISAGYDAHRADPLANIELETKSYGRMSALLAGLAAECEAPLGFVLEGGYDLQALASSVATTLAAAGVLGEKAGDFTSLSSGERGNLASSSEGLVQQALNHYSQWWPL